MMEKYLTKEIQKNVYQILQVFHETCENNQIKYSMAYGTLLGAIRHKNFIPWDDDIDVFMLRSEYEKLQSVFKNDYYELVDWDRDEEYPYLFPKIRKKDTVLIEEDISDINYNIGIYIDIFILDEVPNGIRSLYKEIEFLIKYKLYRLCTLNLSYINPFLRGGAFLFRRFISCNKLAKKCSDVYKNEQGDLLRDASMLNKNMYLKKVEMDVLESMTFCDSCFWGSSHYDAILTRFYNDYMKIPEEEDRISNHFFYKIKV